MDNRQIAESWLQAFRQRDLSGLALAEDFVHTSPYGEIQGRQAYLDLVRQYEEAFFRSTLQVQDLFGSGEKYAVRYLVDGNPACDCIYIQEGRIWKIFSYYHLGEKPAFKVGTPGS